MRKLKTNAQDPFRVKAYAGTNGELRAFDVDDAKKPALLGFAIEQKEGKKDWQWLVNIAPLGLWSRRGTEALRAVGSGSHYR